MMPLEHRKSLTETTIPPPPQYKGVHFAPQVEERRGSIEDSIPVEGLPTRPAMPKNPQLGETVAIQVRKNNPVPLLASVTSAKGQSSFEKPTAASEVRVKKQPPAPPPKTSTLSSVRGPSMASVGGNPSASGNSTIKGVRDKARAASAAGCEIVFVSPDEGFNEEVVLTSAASTSSSSASEAIIEKQPKMN